MPIQIRELVVTATIEERDKNNLTHAVNAAPSSKSGMEAHAIVQACMDEVTKVLKQNTRR